MRIYTRTGDDGTTALLGGARTTKGDLRVEAYGTLDEANAALGMARALGLPREVDAVVASLQSDLFALGAELSSAPGTETSLPAALLGKRDTERLERAIDEADAGLLELHTFIVPGGTGGASALHLARCIVRRAERLVVRQAASYPIRAEMLMFLNRASDLLFVLARRANAHEGTADVSWRGGR
jgi:cob(I)alamin adenosyltransferase